MKTNDLQAAMAAFLSNNPDLTEGEESELTTKDDKATKDKATKKVELHVSIEKKGRNGKVATIVDGLSTLEPAEVELLSKELKKKLGVGGSFREDEILIQGNLREKVVSFLKEKGFRVK